MQLNVFNYQLIHQNAYNFYNLITLHRLAVYDYSVQLLRMNCTIKTDIIASIVVSPKGLTSCDTFVLVIFVVEILKGLAVIHLY